MPERNEKDLEIEEQQAEEVTGGKDLGLDPVVKEAGAADKL